MEDWTPGLLSGAVGGREQKYESNILLGSSFSHKHFTRKEFTRGPSAGLLSPEG